MTEKRSPTLQPERMRLAEYDRQDWVINCEPEITVEDILEPGYWAHVAQLMKPYDHIEARAEDGTWVADLVVTGCDRTWAKVALKQQYHLTSKDVSLSQANKHEVQWKGPQLRWATVRTDDRAIVKAGFQTKEEAGAWTKEHEKVT